MKNYQRLIAVTGVALFACAFIAFAQPPGDITPAVDVDVLMQRKLHSAQSLLKGLALDDFELLEKEAQTLQLLSLDAGWNIVQTDEYARISGEFRQAAKQLSKAAEDKNLDAAGLGYVKLTLTCIDCHRHVRNVQDN